MIDAHTPPLVSVVMPAYQSQTFIESAISSVLAQNYAQFELIVVDDGSTDATPDIATRFADQDSRVRVVRLTRNVGAWAAREIGIAESCGTLITFMDSDDNVAADFLAKMVSALNTHDADIAVCGIKMLDEAGRVLRDKLTFSVAETVRSGALGAFCDLTFGTGSMCNKLYRRSGLAKARSLRLSERIDVNEDYIFNIAVFYTAGAVRIVSDTTYFYRVRPGSVTSRSSVAEKLSTMLRAYAVCHEAFGTDDNELSRQIDRLYAHQLGFPAYRGATSKDLAPWADHIADSVRRLIASRPTLAAEFVLAHFQGEGDGGSPLRWLARRLGARMRHAYALARR